MKKLITNLSVICIGICIGLFCAVRAQDSYITITGLVLDNEEGDPIPGAAVQVVGMSIGTVTDWDGAYTISAPWFGSLTASQTGYKSKTKAINNRNKINFVLKPESGSEAVLAEPLETVDEDL